ncbi:MAG: PAS domain S-box protein [Ruminococcus sp.]|nr:PAS domain S-box protein [Ruminococcus sp.]
MTKKIFLSIFITSVVSVISAILALVLLINSEGIGAVIIAGVVIIAFACLISLYAARKIVKPIKSIDPTQPHYSRPYKELSPLIDRLHKQNGRVNRYMTELTDSREQFSLITESMKDGIVIADPKTTILTCNSAACQLLGIEPLAEGQSIYALSNTEPFRRCIQDAMGGLRSEVIINTSMGDRKIIASPASISDTLNGIVVFIMDVTEEQALEKMRREFTSNVSHELKTPLTTIYGISDMLANGMVRAENVAEFGGNIRREADRLISLINDIVSLSRLDESDVPRQWEEVELYSLAEEVIGRLSRAAEEKDVSAKLIGEQVTITGDRTILSEVMYNLCENAIKYNKDGGHYTVRISHIPMKAIITVTDTGIGIPSEHIERIFERFYRVDKSRSQKIKGTGLGLSIVKHGVGYHRGTVRAVNSDEGMVFIVELPIKNTDE